MFWFDFIKKQAEKTVPIIAKSDNSAISRESGFDI